MVSLVSTTLPILIMCPVVLIFAHLWSQPSEWLARIARTASRVCGTCTCILSKFVAHAIPLAFYRKLTMKKQKCAPENEGSIESILQCSSPHTIWKALDKKPNVWPDCVWSTPHKLQKSIVRQKTTTFSDFHDHPKSEEFWKCVCVCVCVYVCVRAHQNVCVCVCVCVCVWIKHICTQFVHQIYLVWKRHILRVVFGPYNAWGFENKCCAKARVCMIVKLWNLVESMRFAMWPSCCVEPQACWEYNWWGQISHLGAWISKPKTQAQILREAQGGGYFFKLD